MTLYKGAALRQQTPADKERVREMERETWRLYMRELRLQAGGFISDDDDGRGDESAPDAGWVPSFNADQNGSRNK